MDIQVEGKSTTELEMSAVQELILSYCLATIFERAGALGIQEYLGKVENGEIRGVKHETSFIYLSIVQETVRALYPGWDSFSSEAKRQLVKRQMEPLLVKLNEAALRQQELDNTVEEVTAKPQASPEKIKELEAKLAKLKEAYGLSVS